MTTTFQYQLTVPSSAIDAMGHVNNVVYLQWVQDAAEKHWLDKGVHLREIYAWVALDHHITYKAPAFEGEILEISTFVKGFSGPKSERHTQIKRLSDGKLMASAVTNWCLLKMPEGKPMRVPEEICNLFGL